MAEHTLGPWEWDDHYLRSQTAKSPRYPDMGMSISVYDIGAGSADLALIAAAPDLLAALEGLLSEVDEPFPNGTWDEHIDAARAAVKKARGDG